jgi:translocation and assembly module TamB
VENNGTPPQLPPADQPDQPRRSFLKNLGRVAVGCGLGITGLTLGGLWYVRHFINTELTPQLQRELTKQLQRPVNLGKVEEATLGGLRIGKSTIPATDQVSNTFTINQLDIQLDLWRYFQVGKVGVNVRAEGVTALFPQTAPVIPPPDQPPVTTIPVPTVVVEPPSLVELQGLTIVNGTVTIQGGVDGKLVTIGDIQGRANFNLADTNNQTLQLETTGKFGDRGVVKIAGNYILNRGSGDVSLKLDQISVQPLQSVLVGVPVLPQGGELNANVQMILSDNGVIQSVQGFAGLRSVSLLTGALPQPITDITGEVRVDGLTLTIPKLEGKLGAIVTQVKGVIGLEKGQLDVEVQTKPTEIRDIIASTGIKTDLTLDGTVQLIATARGTTAQPQITAELRAPQALMIDRVALANLNGKFSTQLVNGQETVLRVDRLDGLLQGGGNLAGKGKVSAQGWDLELGLTGVNAEAIAQLYETKLPVRVGDISGVVTAKGALDQPEITAQISAVNAEYPAQITATIVQEQALIRSARIEFPEFGGSASIQGTYNLKSGAWQAQLSALNLPLRLISGAETGTANLQADLGNDRGSFNLSDIAGTIAAELPNGISALPEPISLKGTWNGSALNANAQVGDLLSLQGRVGISLPEGITDLDLGVTARSIAVNKLALLIPKLPANAQGVVSFDGRLVGKPANLQIDGKLNLDKVNLADISQVVSIPFMPSQGLISFNGQVNGNLPTPRLVGNWRISDVALQNLSLALVEFRGTVDAFAPVPVGDGVLRLENLNFNQIPIVDRLMGEVSYRGDRGLQVNLESEQGQDDRLIVELDQRFLPIKLDAQLLGGAITAQSQDQKLRVSLNRLPLNLVSTNLDGRLSSILNVDLANNFQTSGDITIDQPRFGRAILDRFSARLDYRDNQLAITNGDLRFPDQQGAYNFQVSYDPRLPTPIQGELTIDKGTIQGLTAALQWNEFRDIARGLELPRSSAITIANLTQLNGTGSLYSQLQYLSQLQARQLEEEQRSGADALFPPLAEFRGGLSGRVAFTTDSNFVPSFDFNVSSQQIEYGKFAIEEFQAKGSYRNEVLKLAELRLGSAKSFMAITDAVLVPSLFTRPLSLDSLSGLLGTEQRGKIQLVDFPIETLRPFPFYQAIPVEITGNVNGKASLSGSLANLKADGNLSVANPTINRQPLELVEGDFKFENFLLSFNGKAIVSGKEPLNVKGSLVVLGGLVDMQINVKNEGLAFLNILEQPVRWVSGEGLASLNIKGQLNAPQIEGKVQLANARLAIFGLNEDLQSVKGELSFNRDRIESNLTAVFSEGDFSAKGAIALNNPQLITENLLTINADRFSLNIRDLSAQRASGAIVVKGSAFAPILTGSLTLADGRFSLSDQSNDPPPFNVAFENLMVKLENMQVTRIPIFNFVADGTIEVNGTAQEILPSGRVSFSRGQFNAISARFRLDRSFDNYAEFIPSQGLNPNLNVRVAGSLAEVTRVPIITDPVLGPLSPRDVPVSTQGAQRTLRVQATVQGTASDPNIILSSSPPRNQSELVALIGGGVVSQTGGADAASAFVNFAGGGILNFLQDLLGDALSVAEFNLNPVTTNPRGAQSSTLGLAAEAAIDFSNSFSAAIRTIINDPNEPTDYSIRYRLDPTIIIRGNINSRGDRGASVEFETRF